MSLKMIRHRDCNCNSFLLIFLLYFSGIIRFLRRCSVTLYGYGFSAFSWHKSRCSLLSLHITGKINEIFRRTGEPSVFFL